MKPPEPEDFQRLSEEHRPTSIYRDIWDALRDNKKWWLLPILIVLMVFGLLILLSGTAVAPFIYTLF